MKKSAASANTLGVIAVMYSGIGVILQLARGVDDEVNTLTAATTTGMLFRSTSRFSHFSNKNQLFSSVNVLLYVRKCAILYYLLKCN